MKKYTNLLMIAAISLLFFAAANAQTPNLITGNSAGKVKIGMTVAQVRKAVAPMRLSRTSDGEGVALIALKNGKNMVMTLYAGEENREAKINEKAKVEQIWVWSKSYKTANGVRAGMLVSQAEKILGPLKEIVRSEIESREFAEFTDQPAGIDLRLNSGDGDFPVGSNRTTKYAPAARIFSINVLGSRVKKDDGITFSSVVTDITKNCKSFGGDDGGHVSTLCPGPAGFQIHYFDSASSYQMNVADASRDWEVPLTGFALDMIKNLKSVEWRLADGIPFAVIFRHPTNGDVIAKGLKSFEKLSVKAEGKPALSIARAMIDEQYKDAIIPATPIYFSGKNTQVTVKGQLPNYDDKLKYRVKGKAGDRLKVSISAVKWKGEEAPVMVGIVTMPDGESDGAPGGTIYDDVLTQDGDYEIVVYQNGAKSQTPNVEIEITFTIVMKADKTAQSSDEIVSGHLPSGVKLMHQVVKGDIGGSANSIVALYAKEGPAMSYSGMVLMPDGTGYKKIDLPQPEFTWSMEEPKAVFFANADNDRELELFIIGECYTGIGPTGAQPFYRTRVYDRNGAGFAHMELISEEIGTLKTAAAIRSQLPAIIKRAEAKFQPIDVDALNKKLADSKAAKTPLQIVSILVDPFSEMLSRSVSIKADSAEEPASLKVIVTDDGYADDSVRGTQYKFDLYKNTDGHWRVSTASKGWRCQQGRGHQDYSSKLCI